MPPEDLQPYLYAAAPGLTSSRHLDGTEAVLVDNAAKRGRLRVTLPGVMPRVTVRFDQTELELPMALDTASWSLMRRGWCWFGGENTPFTAGFSIFDG
ncbi:DUF2169 domain-containing protein [Geomonas sp. Red276]